MKGPSCNLSWFLPRLGCLPTVTAILMLRSARAVAGQALELPPLTTASGNPRLPGKFVWADLVTDDVPAARKFYAQLFGWRFGDMGSYTIAFNDDRPLCGMVQRPRPKDRAADPRWFGYISVASVDRAERAVTKAGGRVLSSHPGRAPDAGTIPASNTKRVLVL